MKVADLWFSALWVLLIPTCSSFALAISKSNGLLGIPSGGSTSTKKTHLQAASIDASAPATVSSATSASEVCDTRLGRNPSQEAGDHGMCGINALKITRSNFCCLASFSFDDSR